MVKKLKIKELKDDPESLGQDRDDLTRISLDDLDLEVSLEVPDIKNSVENTDTINKELSGPKTSPIKEIVEKKLDSSKADTKKTQVETRVEVIDDQLSLERNQINLHLFKGLSFAFIFLILDLIMHLFKILEGVDILSFENFDSIYFNNDQLLNFAKILGFFLIVHWMTPKGRVMLNRRGIFCQHVMVMNLFYSSSQVFLSWDEIKSVKYNVSFFEPYLFFYGADKVELGQIDFTIEQKKEFFKFVEKNAGKNHPIAIVQKEIKLF
jgi:hypothetical protein